MQYKKILSAIVAVAVLGSTIFFFSKETAGDRDPENSDAAADKKRVADATHSATGTYVSPAGIEEIDISVTLVDGIITEATFVGKTVNPTSKKMQERFSNGFKEQVVGKSIDEVSLTVVNGSSLTPKGFMAALAKIKAKAS